MSPIPRSLYVLWIAYILLLAYSNGDEMCTEQETEMNLSRHLSVFHDGSVRNVDCTARVTVTKCEGVCSSQAEPSIITGIERSCKCCREIGHRSKSVMLDECHDGTELLPGVRPMTTVMEPNGCSCQECRN